MWQREKKKIILISCSRKGKSTQANDLCPLTIQWSHSIPSKRSRYLGSMPPSHPHRLVSRSPAPWLVLIVAVDRWFVRSLLALPRLWLLLLLCVCVCVSDRWERRRQTRTRGFPRSPPAQVHRRHFDWESEILARNWQGSAAHPYIVIHDLSIRSRFWLTFSDPASFFIADTPIH